MPNGLCWSAARRAGDGVPVWSVGASSALLGRFPVWSGFRVLVMSLEYTGITPCSGWGTGVFCSQCHRGIGVDPRACGVGVLGEHPAVLRQRSIPGPPGLRGSRFFDNESSVDPRVLGESRRYRLAGFCSTGRCVRRVDPPACGVAIATRAHHSASPGRYPCVRGVGLWRVAGGFVRRRVDPRAFGETGLVFVRPPLHQGGSPWVRGFGLLGSSTARAWLIPGCAGLSQTCCPSGRSWSVRSRWFV